MSASRTAVRHAISPEREPRSKQVSFAGLFIKLGQSIGIQAAILPKAYRDAFATIFDAAPVVPYAEVAKVFQQEFGKSPHDIYEYFEDLPMASASIAQVHRARLRVKNEKTGVEEVKEVAVKVQKPAIKKQMNLDLWSYQSVDANMEIVKR